ncbi:MAG: hypothetical protein CTY25_12065 [Methylobacterium sp.]|nr:MAG: hypothetical protein CTY25_12065 [Methylobacterium sp.]
MGKVVRIVRTERSRAEKAKVEIAGDPEKLEQLAVLEDLIKRNKQVGYKEVTRHALWPLREYLVDAWRHYPARDGALNQTGQLLRDLKASGKYPQLAHVDATTFGRWLVVVRQLVDQELHHELERYIRVKEEEIRAARREARRKGEKYTYKPYAVGPINRTPPLHHAPQSQHDIAPPPAPARAVGGAGEVVAFHPAAQPAARVMPKPTTKEESSRARTRDEIADYYYREKLSAAERATLDAMPDGQEKDQVLWTLIGGIKAKESQDQRQRDHEQKLAETERQNRERAERRRRREAGLPEES